MPRQNFLSRESFVEASLLQAKESLLSIPVFASNIKFVSENEKLQCFKFFYELPQKNVKYNIDVTILSLNNQYTRISWRGEHSNGETFENDSDMAIALHDFEAAMEAALKDDVSNYQPYKPKEKKSKKFLQTATAVLATAGVVLLRKKLS